MQQKKQIAFLLSIDTEEEWLWDGPFPEQNFSVENIKQLSKFQDFCENVGLHTCYFVDYPAAEEIANIPKLLSQLKSDSCEIGAHIHPWTNPPLFDKPNDFNSHVVNLPIEQVRQKLDTLLTLFKDRLDCVPKSFRSGRWGLTSDILKMLLDNNFNIDSSVYPFYRNDYFHFDGAPVQPYWPDYEQVLSTSQQREIIEMPVTVGFNRTPFSRAAKIHDYCQRPFMQIIRSTAFLRYSHILRKTYFSPEVATSKDMIALAEASLRNGNDCLHMYFHSSSLVDHATGFFNEDNAFDVICERIKTVVDHLNEKYDVIFMTPSEYKIYLQQQPENIAK